MCSPIKTYIKKKTVDHFKSRARNVCKLCEILMVANISRREPALFGMDVLTTLILLSLVENISRRKQVF